MPDHSAGQTVYTLAARCRDCYRCLKVCPVKAIRMTDGQAHIDESKCIQCGACLSQCPQGAIILRGDVAAAETLLDGSSPVAASVDPAFAAEFSGWQKKRLLGALRKLGFKHIAETAAGAAYAARTSYDIMQNGRGSAHICTACPAAVNFIERHRPDLAENLLPVASPMIMHARHIRALLGAETKVVYIGPCSARKAEAQRPANAGLVDAVLTFRELRVWLGKRKIDLANCEESDFDDTPNGNARLIPLAGGLPDTSGPADGLSPLELLTVTGPHGVKKALDAVKDGMALNLNPLFCTDGCLNGPGMSASGNVFKRRAEMKAYIAETPVGKNELRQDVETSAEYSARAPQDERIFSEEEITRVLALTGKADVQQQLNCGACGYDSCRKKAIAVLSGMAEPEMCIPYMRRLAEQRSDLVIENNPNGIVVLNSSLEIKSMNPAFRALFQCTDEIIGRPLSYLMDAEPFEKVLTETQSSLTVTANHPRYGIICRQIIYPLKDEKSIVGVFMPMDSGEHAKLHIQKLKDQTVAQAREMLEYQVAMAQKIARYLGESTAKTEELAKKLSQLNADADEN